jgi:hypothetical protein
MSNTPAWKVAPADSASTDTVVPALEDKLLAELADVAFAKTTEPVVITPAAQPAAVPPQPVHAIDPDYQGIHAALQAGTIPTFADVSPPANAPPAILDPIIERQAYMDFLQFVDQHKAPGTAVSAIDPDDYASGLV